MKKLTDCEYRCELIMEKYLEEHILWFLTEYPNDRQKFVSNLHKAFHNSLDSMLMQVGEKTKADTNGNVIKTMFPNAEYEAGEQFMHITDINSIGELSVPLNWWNAPYKREGEG